MEQSQPTAASKREMKRWLRLGASLVVVTLIVAIIGSIFIFMMGSQPTTPLVTGAFIGTPQSQADGYRLTFGVITPQTEFADCNVVLSINGTPQPGQPIDIANGNSFAANIITWTDLDDVGIINKNDSLVVSNPVSNVTYDVIIIWAAGGNIICHQSWTVP